MTARRSLLLCFRHVSAVWHGPAAWEGAASEHLVFSD